MSLKRMQAIMDQRPCRCIACDPFRTNYSACVASRDRSFDALAEAIRAEVQRRIMWSWIAPCAHVLFWLTTTYAAVSWGMK